MGQDGVDSTHSSLLYQRILNNNDPTEVKAYETPFEIYIARKCNAFRKSRLQDKVLLVLGGFALRITETGVLGKLGNYESKLKKPQADVKSGCSEHNIGEKMYVRLIGKPSNKRHFTQSCIENRKIKLHTYKVSNTSLLSGKEERKIGLCGRYHKPHIRAIKTETKMPRLSQKKKKLTSTKRRRLCYRRQGF